MFQKKKKATLMSLLSLLVKPYYRRKPAFVEVVVRIGTFWYTIRGSNDGGFSDTIENRRFEASPKQVFSKVFSKFLSFISVEMFDLN